MKSRPARFYGKHIFKIISLSSSHIILVFLYHMSWKFSDRDLIIRASNAGGVGKNRDSRWISGYRIDDCSSSSSHMRVINYNWSATKQRPHPQSHPQSVAEISRHSVLSGGRIQQCETDIVWVSPQRHRSVSVSRHFLLQAPQCPCSVWKRFSRDHCCWGRSKPGC